MLEKTLERVKHMHKKNSPLLHLMLFLKHKLACAKMFPARYPHFLSFAHDIDVSRNQHGSNVYEATLLSHFRLGDCHM